IEIGTETVSPPQELTVPARTCIVWALTDWKAKAAKTTKTAPTRACFIGEEMEEFFMGIKIWKRFMLYGEIGYREKLSKARRLSANYQG
ncbi:MAG: hypothetical protein ACKOX4_12400, partial [Bacteroidota bacterium]